MINKFMNKIAATLLFTFWAVQVNGQTCNEHLAMTAPDYRYVDHGDGTFTDKVTNLMWSHCFLGETWDGGQCTGDAIVRDWDTVLVESESTQYAEYTDWRLPNVNEFWAVQEKSCIEPATNMSYFGDDQYFYLWTATPDFRDTLSAFRFTFGGRIDGIPARFGSQRIKSFVSSRARIVRDISG